MKILFFFYPYRDASEWQNLIKILFPRVILSKAFQKLPLNLLLFIQVAIMTEPPFDYDKSFKKHQSNTSLCIPIFYRGFCLRKKTNRIFNAYPGENIYRKTFLTWYDFLIKTIFTPTEQLCPAVINRPKEIIKIIWINIFLLLFSFSGRWRWQWYAEWIEKERFVWLL